MKKGQKSSTNGRENFLCPVTDMYITQGAGGNYSHKGTMAVDIRGLESGVRYAYYAPCTCKCLHVYPSSGQSMWQSTGNVNCPNGYKGKVTFMIAHDDTQDCYVGQVVPQGNQLGNMGTKGNATGVHVHFQGAQTSSDAWVKNSYGIYYFPSGEKDLDQLCYMDDTNIMNCPTLEPVYVNNSEEETKIYGTTVARDKTKNQIEIFADNVRARKSPNGDILGYMKKGIYNYSEVSTTGGYDWYKVADNLWFAFGAWSNVYKKEEPETPVVDYKLKGIDISHYQSSINLSSLDIDFVIMKATEGVGYQDAKFTDFYTTAQQIGKNIGVYHVCRPDLGNTAKDEADYFLSIVGDAIGKAMLILDIEPSYLNVSWAKEWLDYVKKKTGVTPVIYIGDSMEANNDWSSICEDYPLWIASYGSNTGKPGTKPDLTYWKEYIMWQYTSKGKIDGYSGDLDLDYFYKDNWNDYIIAEIETPETPSEGESEEITSLKKENEALKAEIEVLNQKIKDLEKETNILYSQDIFEEGIYAIKLYNGETIIVKTTEE